MGEGKVEGGVAREGREVRDVKTLASESVTAWCNIRLLNVQQTW